MSNDLINRKQLTGELYNAIVEGLKSTFKNVYPAYEIVIKYNSENSHYYFSVYLEGETFGVRDQIPMLKPHLVFIDQYVNSDAILFSEHSRDKYEAQFNDYQEGNYDIIRDGIEDIAKEFEEQVEVTQKRVDRNGYHVRFKIKPMRPGQYSGDYYVSHYFSVQPPALKTAKAAVSKIRRVIKGKIERVTKPK